MRRADRFHTPALTDGEALAWLRARGTVRKTVRELAAEWGMPVSTVGRRLQQWEEARLIVRHGSPRQRMTIYARDERRPTPPPAITVNLTIHKSGDGHVRAHGRIGDARVVLSGSEAEVLADIAATIREAGHVR